MSMTPRSIRSIGRATRGPRRRITAALTVAVLMGGAAVSAAHAATPTPREGRDTGFLYVNSRMNDGVLSLGLTQDAGWMHMTKDLPREELNTVAVHIPDDYKEPFPDEPAWSEYTQPGSPFWSSDGVEGPLSLAFTAVDLKGDLFADPVFPVTVNLEGVRGSDGAAAPGYLWWGEKPSEFNPPSNAVVGSGPEQSRSTVVSPMMNIPASVQATAAGGYCVDLTVSGLLADGTTEVTSPVTTLAIAVGDETDPASVVCGDEDLVAAESTTTVSVSGPADFGRERTATVQVTAEDQPAAGAVTVKLGETILATTDLADGQAQVAIPATTPAGAHEITASYGGSSDPAAPVAESSDTTSLSVTKARTAAQIALAKKKIGKGKRAKATVSVRIPDAADGIHPTGKIRLYDGTKRIKTVVLRARNHGELTLTLPKLKPGKHRIRATYAGSADTRATSAPRVTLRVTKK